MFFAEWKIRFDSIAEEMTDAEFESAGEVIEDAFGMIESMLIDGANEQFVALRKFFKITATE